MSRPQVVIGLDIGTTGVRAVAYDRHGTDHGSAAAEYPLDTPQPGRAEQDPDTIAEAAQTALAKATRSAEQAETDVAGVALSAAMHSLVGLDADLLPLTPSITWADGRAASQAARLRRDDGCVALARRTGTPVHPMSPMCKLMWFREEDPATFEAVRRWVSIKEYVLARLGAQMVADHSIASASGLFNLESRDWDPEALELAGVGPDRLSPLVPTDHVVGGRWVVGASDGVLANLGVGAVAPDVAAITIGTSGALRVLTDSPRTDPGGQLFCYALTSQRWVVGGAINNGGLVLRWLRDAVFDRDDEALIAEAAGTAAGADGLLFLPYLAGERAPRWSGEPRAAWVGLTLRHDRRHLVRAALEGVALQLRTVGTALSDAGVHPRVLRASGGFVASPLWCRIVADVFGLDLQITEVSQPSAFGAALLGMQALGLVDSIDDAARAVDVTGVIRPDPADTQRYAALLAIFTDLWDRLEPVSRTLAAHDEGEPAPRAGSPQGAAG